MTGSEKNTNHSDETTLALRERLANAHTEAERAALLVELAEVSVQLDRFEDAAARLWEAVALYETLAKGSPGLFEEALARVHLPLGQVLAREGHLVEAAASLRMAVTLFAKLSEDSSSEGARFNRLLLSSLSALGRLLLQSSLEEGVRFLERAVALHELEVSRGRATDPLEAALDQSALGTALAGLGRYDESVSALNRATSSFEELVKAGAEVDYAFARNLSTLAGVWRLLSRWKYAVEVSNRAIGLYERLEKAGAGGIVRQRLIAETEFRDGARVMSGEVVSRCRRGPTELWKTNRWILGKLGSGDKEQTIAEPSDAPAPEDISTPVPVVSANDRRFWCTTFRNVPLIIEALLKAGLPSRDVHTLARGLRERSLYPVRDLGQYFHSQGASVFVSHDWSDDFVNLKSTLNSAMELIASIVRRDRPDLGNAEVEALCLDKIGVWIDFLFIDQSARKLLDEVNLVVPAVIRAADMHFVLSPTAISRAWCCYELALFNRRPTPTGGEGMLRSIIAPAASSEYHFWAGSKTSVPDDKPVLENWLRRHYPGGLDGVDGLLVIASMLSDRFVVGPWAITGGAEEQVAASIDKWLAR